nr:hypothetical protein [Acinetobacter soli]
MTKKLYYWAENLENYSSDIDKSFPLSIEIKRLNFFIGKNNSGKSRFVRNLFTNSSYTISDYSFPDLTDFFTELKIIFENTHGSLWIGNTSSGSDRSTLLNSIQDVINFPTYPKGKYKDNYSKNISLLAKARFEHTTFIEDKVKEIEKYVSDYESTLISEDNKFYIPVLRGMRPVTDITNKQPYIERAQKDYFSEILKYNQENIVTGECLYYQLKTHLLGEPEQRDLIKSYEEKLSLYFFDNEPITLIPKHDHDVVNIKIGSEKQFPISHLGDGLQQSIILTFEAYIRNLDKNGNKKSHVFL